MISITVYYLRLNYKFTSKTKYKMSIKENNSSLTIEPSKDSQEENVISCRLHKQGQSSNVQHETIHKLSLEFRCSDTPHGQRKICNSFWEVIKQHPEFDLFMARGWSEKEKPNKPKHSSKAPPTPSPCEELQEFIDQNVDELVLRGLKRTKFNCAREILSQTSSTDLIQELKKFDNTLQTEISSPPKTPRPTD